MQGLIDAIAAPTALSVVIFGLCVGALFIARWWFRYRPAGVTFSQSRSVQIAAIVFVGCGFVFFTSAEEPSEKMLGFRLVGGEAWIIDADGEVIEKLPIEEAKRRILGAAAER